MVRVQKLNVQLQINEKNLKSYIADGYKKVEKPVGKVEKPSKKQPEKAYKKSVSLSESADDAQ